MKLLLFPLTQYKTHVHRVHGVGGKKYYSVPVHCCYYINAPYNNLYNFIIISHEKLIAILQDKVTHSLTHVMTVWLIAKMKISNN